MKLYDLGNLAYRDAWAKQETVHADVLGGAEETLLLVEHPPVITLGRRAEIEGPRNLIASEAALKEMGVELVQSDRGGDITFHGPGQVVAYPIVRLNDHALSVGAYVRRLEQVVIDSLKEFGIDAVRSDGCVGIWIKPSAASPGAVPMEKVCAIGVRVKRGVSLHGIALNVDTDLRYFDLIVPCGLNGKRATSLRKLLGDSTPPMQSVKDALARQFTAAFQPVNSRS